MKVEVLSGVPGCGKSTTMRHEALSTPGLYLFAMPTIPLIEEQAAAFRAEAAQKNIPLLIIPIHSESEGRSRGSVPVRMQDALTRIEEDGAQHVVMLITHETLMNGGLSGFHGWHARIDEVPASAQSGTIKIRSKETRDFFKRNFELSHVTGGWSEARPLSVRSSFRDREDDAVLSNVKEFLKHADRDSGAFVNALDWSKNDFGWCAVWTPLSLEHFESVQIAGAAYIRSLGGLVAERWQHAEIQIVNRQLSAVRTGQPAIRVHYFTRGHEGTTALWDTSPGRAMIVPICNYLADLNPPLGFWSANTEVQKLLEHRVAGGPIKPKVAGLNEYADKTSCAFIYSAKATTDDAPFKSLFGITDEEIQAAREDEDVLQFVMRGAIRKPTFDKQYDIYVYSLRQAKKLKDQLDASGVGTSVLVPVFETNIMDAAPVRMKHATQPASERKEKARLRSKRNRDKKAVAAGRPTGKRGRPPKSGL